ncbi:unnamed protein product [Rotaria sp. Silwood1]|nr:unnamed protein product [Rotaria sp. Silwood1]CAF1059005.1 unnamed protein product [Rotaria sp. Silwood1]CAF3416838.1 unnamed protein product [Rotaria sp. Silwood1]CAF3426234.1 unnamed protein product [Rotaria sp. Silwood1]CAF4562439.1 unnamed protein product [Rotaria sp. Silwood1]
MNSIYNFFYRQCLCLTTRHFLIKSRTYKSNLSYDKLFPNCKSLDILSGPIKSPTNESTGNAKFNGFIPIDKLEITHRHARGPGGQHVNKTLSGVEIRFHVDSATWIPDWIKSRFRDMNQTRINRDGYFIIFSDETRHRLLNQAQCLDRIRALIRDASLVPKGLSDEERKTIEERKKVSSNERVIRKRIQSLNKQERRPSSTDLS